MKPLGLIALVGSLAFAGGAVRADLLDLPPHATRTAEVSEPLSSYRLPIGPWDGSQIQTIWAEGEILREAWNFQAEGLTTLQLLAPLRDQLAAQGFDILFECEAATCGGFDFRYATEILPEPEMHVDLGDYRFVSAQRMGADAPEYVSLMVSRSSIRGFVQLTRVGPALAVDAAQFTASTKNPDPAKEPPAVASIGGLLEDRGRAVLTDLSFEIGSAQLRDQEFASLQALADYLLQHPDRGVTLVGHTDAEGTLEANIALSQKRAEAVRAQLIEAFQVPAEQVQAQGVGYLAPMASNLTDDGRTKNRRVEVILTSTQ
ncbi:OmpA family protein [Actibacterium sp.]|uniref:OmpA family protein n=1 Tax=Actibacterium sp. TaxID=1872125 RepID=UPI003561A22F